MECAHLWVLSTYEGYLHMAEILLWVLGSDGGSSFKGVS